MRISPITLTLPESLVKDLHLYISKRQNVTKHPDFPGYVFKVLGTMQN